MVNWPSATSTSLPSSQPGEDSDEEDHADEGEGDEEEHDPQEPVDGFLGVLLQPLRFRLQLIKVHVGLPHRVAERLREPEGEGNTGQLLPWTTSAAP